MKKKFFFLKKNIFKAPIGYLSLKSDDKDPIGWNKPSNKPLIKFSAKISEIFINNTTYYTKKDLQ